MNTEDHHLPTSQFFIEVFEFFRLGSLKLEEINCELASILRIRLMSESQQASLSPSLQSHPNNIILANIFFPPQIRRNADLLTKFRKKKCLSIELKQTKKEKKKNWLRASFFYVRFL